MDRKVITNSLGGGHPVVFKVQYFNYRLLDNNRNNKVKDSCVRWSIFFFLTVHLRIILVGNQLDAQFLL